MSKLDELIEKLCPNGVEYKTIQEICNITRGRVMSKDYIKQNKGDYPVYSSQTENNGELGKISTYDYEGEYLTWTTDGANAGSVFYRNGKFSVTNVCGLLRVTDTNILTKFLYHILLVEAPKYVNAGMGNPKLMSNVMGKIKVAVPPLEVQHEIVHILDDFTLLSAELSAELKARQKQFKHYLNKVFIQENCEYKKLEEICEIRGRIGFRGYTKEDMVREGEGAISLTASNITRGYHTDYTNNTYLNWEKYEESPEIMVSNGDIILCQRGSIGKSAIVENLPEKATINPQLLLLKNIKCNNYYLALYFRTNDFLRNLEKITGYGTVQMIAQKDVKKLEIPVPTKERQKEIVNILNKLDKMCNDISEGLPAEIEARQKQYEYYRDKLLTFKELKVNE